MRVTTTDKVKTENDSNKPTVAPPNAVYDDGEPDTVVVLREGVDEADIAKGSVMSLTFGLVGYAVALALAAVVVLAIVQLT